MPHINYRAFHKEGLSDQSIQKIAGLIEQVNKQGFIKAVANTYHLEPFSYTFNNPENIIFGGEMELSQELFDSNLDDFMVIVDEYLLLLARIRLMIPKADWDVRIDSDCLDWDQKRKEYRLPSY